MWRLSIDMGTNSIGWSVITLAQSTKTDTKYEPVEVKDMGVRIFSDGREPARNGRVGDSLAVARRLARGIRRNIYRRKLRRRAVFRQLREDGLFPASKEACIKLKELNPYEFRVQALNGKLSKEKLARALFLLGVRRGFQSSRKEMPKSSEAKKELEGQALKIEALSQKLKQGEFRTLGEFLYQTQQEGKTVRFTADNGSFYPLRQMYKDEFDAIRKKQERYYTEVRWDALSNAIFYQRPLKPQERGKCQFFTDKDRTFKVIPSSHRCRILQEVHNLIMYDDNKTPVLLTKEQREILIDLLDSKKEVKFDEMRKKLKIDYIFNLESDLRKALKGNETAVIMRSEKKFGSAWNMLSYDEQDTIIELLITAQSDTEIFNLLGMYPQLKDITAQQREGIVGYSPSSGTTSLCKSVTQLLVETMEQDDVPYTEAMRRMGLDHSKEMVEKYDLLPYYGKVLTGSTIGGNKKGATEKEPERLYGKIGNPTVHVALNQIRTVVNELIKVYGKPAQVVIELTRDLKTSRDSKEKIIAQQTENVKRNAILNRNIHDIVPSIQYPGRFERSKMKLWEELSKDALTRRCIYCGKIISCSEIFTSNIEVEHILPYARTLMDGESNKTVAHRKCNAFKGNRSPFEAFDSSPKGYNWQEIVERSKILPLAKQKKFNADAMEKLEGGFIDRQLTDNAYISKVTRKYMTSICDNVWVTNGMVTKLLRDTWEIDAILKRRITQKEIAHFSLKDEQIGLYKKNRFDHRHHALDALVIGLVDRQLIQEISTKNAQGGRIIPPQFSFSREEIIEKVKNIVISYKPEHGTEGKLSKETYLGKIKREKKIALSDLTEDSIVHIKNEEIKAHIQTLCNEKGLTQTKKELESIYPSLHIFDEKFVCRSKITSFDKRKDIEAIVDEDIRKKLTAFADIHVHMKFEDMMQKFSKETGIKKLRCYNFVQTPIQIAAKPHKPLTPDRYLVPEDYFAALIWEIPSEKSGGKVKFEAQYIKRSELSKDKKPIEKKPHSCAKKICQLHKNDYIEFSENGIWKKARIVGYSASQNKLDIRPIYAATNAKDWIIATNERMLEGDWKESIGHYYVAVNVLFGDKSARRITVSPIGRVCRKNSKQ